MLDSTCISHCTIVIIQGKDTYWSVLKSGPHWCAEATCSLVMDALLGFGLYRPARRWLKRHDAKNHQGEAHAV